MLVGFECLGHLIEIRGLDLDLYLVGQYKNVLHAGSFDFHANVAEQS